MKNFEVTLIKNLLENLLWEFIDMTNSEILLKFGEMSRSELRTAKAIVSHFEREIEHLKSQIKQNVCSNCTMSSQLVQ